MSKGVRFEDCTAVRETEKALLIEIEGTEHWVPKAVIHADSEVFDADDNSEGDLVLEEWFAEKEGLA